MKVFYTKNLKTVGSLAYFITLKGKIKSTIFIRQMIIM